MAEPEVTVLICVVTESTGTKGALAETILFCFGGALDGTQRRSEERAGEEGQEAGVAPMSQSGFRNCKHLAG